MGRAELPLLMEELLESTGYQAVLRGERSTLELEIPRMPLSMMFNTFGTILDLVEDIPTTAQAICYDAEVKAPEGSEMQFGTEERKAGLLRAEGRLNVSHEIMGERAEMIHQVAAILRNQIFQQVHQRVAQTFLIPLSHEINEYPQPGSWLRFLEKANLDIQRNGKAEMDAAVMSPAFWRAMGRPIRQGGGLPIVLLDDLPDSMAIAGAFRDHCTIRSRPVARVVLVPHGVNPRIYRLTVDARYTFYIRRGLAFCRAVRG